MRIEYWCKYCRHLVGELDEPGWALADAQRHLGLLSLSGVEQAQVSAYTANRDVLYVRTVCEYCQHALESYPEVLLEGKLLQ